MKRAFKILFVLAVVLVAASVGVPYLGGNQFKPTVEARLASSLGRKVEIRGEVRFQLWPRPGFSAYDVVVDELPEYGVEPFAYVGELDVAMDLIGLLRGRFDPVVLTLQPSDEKDVNINLVRVDSAGWNFQPLLNSALAQRGPLPDIDVQGGRINIKFGDTKSILYLAETVLSVEAEPGDAGHLNIRFEGEPARTDRPARAFGTLSGRGWVKSGGTTDMRLAVQRMAISEIMTLANGVSSGLGGFLSSNVHLTGSVQNIAIDGTVQLGELGRLSTLFAGAPKRVLEFEGSIDGPGRSLKIETRAQDKDPLPLSARVRVTDWLTSPRWGVLLTMRELPFASVRSIASETGATFPTQLPIEGNLSGALGYSPTGGLKGMLSLTGGTMVLSKDVSYPVESASVIVDGPKFFLQPSIVQTPTGPLKMEGSYEMTSGDMDAKMDVPSMEVADFRGLWNRLAGSELLPVIADAEKGKWSGNLRYQRKGEKRSWLGDVSLEGVSLAVDGFASPLQIDTARLRILASGFEIPRMEGSVERLRFSGSYSFSEAARTAYRARLSIAKASLDEIEKVLEPSLTRSQGLIQRTLGNAPMMPEWLINRRVDVDFEIGTLAASGYDLEGVRGQLLWNGKTIDVREFSGTSARASVRGSLLATLGGRQPRYRGELRVVNADWRGGEMEAEMKLSASGSGGALKNSMRLDGTFAGRDIVLGQDGQWHAVSGGFSYEGGPGGPKISFTGLNASTGSEKFSGQGSGGPDGKVMIELAAQKEQVRIAGELSGMHLDFGPR